MGYSNIFTKHKSLNQSKKLVKPYLKPDSGKCIRINFGENALYKKCLDNKKKMLTISKELMKRLILIFEVYNEIFSVCSRNGNGR